MLSILELLFSPSPGELKGDKNRGPAKEESCNMIPLRLTGNGLVQAASLWREGGREGGEGE